MSELLVMAIDNWMVNANKEGWSDKQIAKANRQYQAGDIIQSFENGKLQDDAHANGLFHVIRIRDLKLKKSKEYIKEITEDRQETLVREVEKYTWANPIKKASWLSLHRYICDPVIYTETKTTLLVAGTAIINYTLRKSAYSIDLTKLEQGKYVHNITLIKFNEILKNNTIQQILSII